MGGCEEHRNITMLASLAIRALEHVFVAFVILVIRAYQNLVSPLLIGGCRHWPTCSRYAEEALWTHGLKRGLVLSAQRLWRCRPGGSYGYNPVPERQADATCRTQVNPT